MTSRLKRFTHGLISGYGAIILNVLYTIFSVRLALYYLGKEKFGLWGLALQIAGYMALLDLGMSSAVSRFVADHKDDVNGGEYGSLLLTGGLVFVCQGLLVAIVGGAFSFVAPLIFHIPKELAPDFQWVLVITTSLSGFSIATRSIGAPLWAFQRTDVSNLFAMMTLIISYFFLWLGFKTGCGIYSLAYAGIPAAIILPIILTIICHRNGYYPAKGYWGAPRWNLFYKVFGFGKDVLLMSLGSQLVNATQIMILSRVVGLDAAATFSIGTKFYTMGSQFVGKILESSAPALTEIFISGDRVKFNERFWNIMSVTALLATIGGTGIMMGNQALVSMWTSGVIHWSLGADVFLATLLIVTSLSRCLVGIFGLVGNIVPVRYIYFLEGCVFIMLALPAVREFGVIGALAASLVAHLSVTMVISSRVALKWLDSMRPLMHLMWSTLTITLIALALAVAINFFHPSSLAVIPLAILVFISVSSVAWLVVLPQKMRSTIRIKTIYR